VERLSSTTWIRLPACGATAFFRNARKSNSIAGGFALTEHFTGTDVRREQVRRAVPDVVVSMFLSDAELDGQQWLSARAWICVFLSSIESTTVPSRCCP
jgi:hypothetical protein